MGASWQTPDQRIFIEDHFPSYLQHLAANTLNAFWPDLLKKWFKLWPLPDPEPTCDPAEGEDAKLKAVKSERSKKIAVSMVYVLTGTLTSAHHLSSN